VSCRGAAAASMAFSEAVLPSITLNRAHLNLDAPESLGGGSDGVAQKVMYNGSWVCIKTLRTLIDPMYGVRR
jgi:hypothetical protein